MQVEKTEEGAVVRERKPHSEETKNKIALSNTKIRTKIICGVCKKDFYVLPSRSDKAKFCSLKCRDISHTGSISFWRGKKLPYNVWNKGIKNKDISGQLHPNWKGGRIISRGYVLIYSPSHPHRSADGYVLEHRLLIENHIGRHLKKNEIVHHINGIKDDNRIENLFLCENQKEHQRIHSGKYKKVGDQWFKFCVMCNKFLHVNEDNFYITKESVSYRCRKHNGK